MPKSLVTAVSALFCLFFIPAAALSAEVTLNWTKPNDSRVTGYHIYYGVTGSNFKSGIDQSVYSSDTTRATISGLVEGQTYDFAATSFDAYGNESDFSETISYTVGASNRDSSSNDMDSDSDGIADENEQGAPNAGDGNWDGVPDADQAHVASFLDPSSGHYITLESDTGTTLENCYPVTPLPENLPASAVFEWGLFAFTITGIQEGGSTRLMIYLPEGAQPTEYQKYGPTPRNPSDHWYTFHDDGQTGAAINGNIITLYFIDAERGDDVLTPDGKIIDEGGPVYATAASSSADTSSGDSPDSSGGGGGGGGCFITTFTPFK